MQKALAVLFLSAAVPAFAGEAPVYTINVQGEAVVSAVPDEVSISLTLEGHSVRSQREAVKLQAEKTAALLAFFKQEGVPDKKIQTTEYWFGPTYEWKQVDNQNKQVFKDFTARQRLTVCVSRDKASGLIDGVPQLATVNGVAFIVSNAKELQEAAVDAAIDDAKARAAKRAARLGVKLGAILGYSENKESPDRPQPAYRTAGMRGESADAAPSLPAGEAELRVSVTLTYQLLVP